MREPSGYYVHQNIGLIDRSVRVVVGAVLLGLPMYELMQPGARVETWHGIAMILSVYPCLTGILGTDPIFKMFGARTCDTSNRNQCGSFPYQVDAFLGNDPIPEDHTEHSLLHSSHQKHA